MSLALLGKLCILAAIFISILYGIELFPTVVRYTRTHAHSEVYLVIHNIDRVIVIQTAVCVHGQLVLPARLSGQLPRPSQPKRSDLIGCHGRVQQRTDRKLRAVPAAAGDQRCPASWFCGGLSQAASAPPTQRARPLEDTVRLYLPQLQRARLCWCPDNTILQEHVKYCKFHMLLLRVFVLMKTFTRSQNSKLLTTKFSTTFTECLLSKTTAGSTNSKLLRKNTEHVELLIRLLEFLLPEVLSHVATRKFQLIFKHERVTYSFQTRDQRRLKSTRERK